MDLLNLYFDREQLCRESNPPTRAAPYTESWCKKVAGSRYFLNCSRNQSSLGDLFGNPYILGIPNISQIWCSPLGSVIPHMLLSIPPFRPGIVLLPLPKRNHRIHKGNVRDHASPLGIPNLWNVLNSKSVHNLTKSAKLQMKWQHVCYQLPSGTSSRCTVEIK